jgi:N-acetylated-alpha-linked acidic dipeptidase
MENLVDVQFKSLRESIHALQQASIALDEEKHNVAKDLRKVIKNLKKRKKFLKKIYCRIKKLFGRKCSCPHKKESPMTIGDQEESAMILGLAIHAGYNARSSLLPHPGTAVNRLRKLVKRIQVVNEKSSAFERGFISTEGIKDREWYKHLAVAPGKWLGLYSFLFYFLFVAQLDCSFSGYGATTFPGLTEAITFEKNSTLAQDEVARLRVLIDNIAKTIKLKETCVVKDM